MVKTYSRQGVRVENPDQNQKTLVLIGRSGNGKSALGNCILGRNAFPSEASPCGVTLNCALEEGLLPDGGMLRIIDTPGHFGHSLKSDVVDSEIRKCFEMAKDEIHALILVLSVNNRFTKAETEGILALTSIFGWNMYDSLVVVFTGGDDLERDGQTLDDYLGPDPPESLQVLLHSCDNRFMVFDCNTLDENKRSVQLSKLLELVEIVTKRNSGKPFGQLAFSPMTVCLFLFAHKLKSL
ncbi:unnamed protein product [Linum tenue]|uniref:AIG1-type G domain-containing protein n=1 Tax=Linum tenue TaxID=586396 RepID=A0AAV0S1H0_9ROSI|nr:unnamed protein product [Linum tenue]